MNLKTAERISPRFGLRTAFLATTSTSVAFAMFLWASAIPPLWPLGTAVLLFWAGKTCLLLDGSSMKAGSTLLLLGCSLLSMAVLVGGPGTLFFALLWFASVTI